MMPYSEPSASPETKSGAESPKMSSTTATKTQMAVSQRPARAGALGPAGRLERGGKGPGKCPGAHEDRVFGTGGSDSLGKLWGRNLDPSMSTKVPGLSS